MEKNENLSVPFIAGYSEAQVLFTIDEITKKTDHISLQMLLYRNFGLYDYQADDLIQKVKNETGLVPTVYVASTAEDLTQMLIQKGYDPKVADAQVREQLRQQNEQNEQRSSGNSFDIIIGVLILGVGLVVTFSGAGVIAYGAIIVGAARIIGGLTSDND
jgi:hypothetical protein